MISGYLCNQCGRLGGFLDLLTTGSLTGVCQMVKIQEHCLGRSNSPCCGILRETSLDAYQERARQIAEAGIVEVETNGCANVYRVFNQPVGEIAYYGISSGDSYLGKAVLVANQIYVHWYPSTGYALGSG